METKESVVFAEEKGMTLVEVLAVIVILGLIIGVVAKNVIGTSDVAKAKLNETKMDNLMNSIGLYRLEYNSIPSALEDLTRASGDIKDQGKVFTALAKKSDLNDVWGYPYIYKTENNKRSFSLTSYGSDGVPGGDGASQDVTKKGP